MKRPVEISLILLFLLTVVSCSNSNTAFKISNIRKFPEMGNNNEIILKEGIIPNNLAIIGVKDEKNFYCLDKSIFKNIYTYNIEQKTKTLFRSPMSPDKFIKSVSVNDNWLVWNENQVEIENDNSNNKNWALYAQDIKTGKVIEIDKYKDIKLDPNSINKTLEPKEISISGDKVVYENYDILNDNTICAVIKVYNLSTKKEEIVDYTKDYKDGFYSHPKIFGNYVVWSLSKCNLSDYSENGSTYIYNIEMKQKKLLTTGNEILWPYIYKNYISARVKPKGQNENSSIVLYDLNKDNSWKEIVSPSSLFYQNKAHVEMYAASIYDKYLIWQDNIRSNVIVYNCENKKFYNIAEKKELDGLVASAGIFNNVLFWDESTPKGTISKFAYLK